MLKSMFFLLPAVLFTASCGENIPPERLESHAAQAVQLFEEVCVGNNGNPQNVAAWASQQQLPMLDEAAVKNLPLGMMELDAQAVWTVEKDGATFYISTAPGSCSVKTPRADHQAARQYFVALAEKGRAGATAMLRADNGVSSPFPFNQLVYGWHENGADEEILLTANTSPSEHVPAQLALYLTRQPLGMKVISTQ
ncbi:hypothetical protein LVJ85_06010 [Neisseria sp. Dent CA1/247]|uniref:NMCC_0638 family (lipo)protein n=1 Tax=Neisseria sp. Dent CA1/247 TaxID=2912675 RepID=UPI001FD21BB1|nr:hypothetical protein [Neisseria sp. Dent CA1/247]UOO78012.1 hypothetical protein LVJ85_06010 [Neisseria sp. Dent CA1/247]